MRIRIPGEAMRLTGLAMALPLLIACSMAVAADKKSAGDSGPGRTFTDVVLLVTTNAEGDVSDVTIGSGNAFYSVITNGLSPTVLKDWLKLHIEGKVEQSRLAITDVPVVKLPKEPSRKKGK